MSSALSGTLAYIKNFFQDRDVAAIAPSSSFLVRRVCKWIDFEEDQIIVEYGPGNGVFSEFILDRMTADSTLLLIESNPAFVEMLEDRTADEPRAVVVEDRAERIVEILDAHGVDAVDYIVSGIPFSFLDETEREGLLARTRDVLAANGKFLVYQNYNHLEAPLREHFSEVTKEYEPRNIPPTMFAYEAQK
ncbi:class I SAM-dependent methyltransferase [Salinibacter altiplanensis]|uniref:class I SAM-dependent methyltransferase n=1 Tax=Salinibacter altiplanensis TaxID=1803181 RepID=UPI001E353128|nr:rRNA adenine N-6-methyltransferase family protein [Salinibacter altiplanensis]